MKSDFKNTLIRPIKDSTRAMRLNYFLSNKYILIIIVIMTDIFFFLLFNYIVNSCIDLFTALKVPSNNLDLINCLTIDNIVFRKMLLNSTTGRFLYAFLATALAILDLCLAYRIRTYLSDVNFNVGQKGDERFATVEEIKQQYKEIAESKKTFSGRGGIPVFRQENKLYIDDSIVNNLFIGMTRSGKGEMFVFPIIDILSRAEEKASLVITDPKLELYKSSFQTLKNRGYDIWLLNLIDPDWSMGYNPLQIITETYKSKDYDSAETLALTFSYSIFNPDNAPGESAFFAQNASTLLTAMILAHVEDCIREDQKVNENRYRLYKSKRNKFDALADQEKETQKAQFYQLLQNQKIDPSTDLKVTFIPDDYAFDYTTENEKKINMFSIINTFTELGASKINPMITKLDIYFSERPMMDRAKMKYASVEVTGDRTKGSIYSEMLSKLTLFTYQSLARMTAESTIDLESVGFGDRPKAIFIGVPDYDKSKNFFVTAFISQLYFILSKKATFSGGKCKRHVKFLCDEFGNMPPIDNMSNIITVCNGRNISFDLIIQAYNQLEKLYGDDAETIISNCGNQVYILSNSTKTAEQFSKLIGSRTDTDLQRSGKKLSLEKHITETLQEKPLLNANQLMELEEGCFVIKRTMKRRDLKGNFIRPYPIYCSDETNSRFKYRYQYLSDEFPDTNSIDFYKICAESRLYISVQERVWNPETTFDYLANVSKNRGEDLVPCKMLSSANEIICKQIKQKYLEYTGENLEEDIPLTELISRISNNPLIETGHKTALISVIDSI